MLNIFIYNLLHFNFFFSSPTLITFRPPKVSLLFIILPPFPLWCPHLYLLIPIRRCNKLANESLWIVNNSIMYVVHFFVSSPSHRHLEGKYLFNKNRSKCVTVSVLSVGWLNLLHKNNHNNCILIRFHLAMFCCRSFNFLSRPNDPAIISHHHRQIPLDLHFLTTRWLTNSINYLSSSSPSSSSVHLCREFLVLGIAQLHKKNISI